jgi:ketosteroid isomerase-like protein
MKLEQTWNDVASIKKDRALLEQILADDYVYTHSNGAVANKAQEITDTMSSEWTSSKTDDMKVRVYGDVAIVTGRQTHQGTAKGYVSGPRRFTDIFVKRNGRWQCAGGQSTLVPAK